MERIFGDVEKEIDDAVGSFVVRVLKEHGDAKQISQALVNHATRLALCASDCGHQISAVLMGEYINVVTEHIADDLAAKFSEASGAEAENEENDGDQVFLASEPDGSDTIH